MINRTARLKKLQRLNLGEQPRVLDLFSGCGGISLGFRHEGFRIVGAIEIDPFAAASHKLNFEGDVDDTDPVELSRDITKEEPEDLLSRLMPGTHSDEAIDLIVGGPPCQAFARVGRAKLREVQEHPKAFKQDPRGNLYLRYIHYVKRLQPLAILMENVPDVINFGAHNIPEETCEVFTSMGYTCQYTLLNSVFYGVPQTRERMFLLAYSNELQAEVKFPLPTHSYSVPRGYEGSRQVALKHVFNGNGHQLRLIEGNADFYAAPPKATRDLPRAVTAEEAIRDLPPITEHLNGRLKRGARHLKDYVAYRAVTPSDYALDMRTWKGFESNGGVYDHTIRSLSNRDFEIFRRMRPGNQYPEAHAIAQEILAERLKNLEEEGVQVHRGTTTYNELLRKIVPPYDPEKFPNKWRKMAAHEPARTLMAHLGKDSYSHIHYDDDQARTISVREAARLMSFPDGFRFVGTMNPAFRQIGNAVPPLMACAIARVILSALKRAPCKDELPLNA